MLSIINPCEMAGLGCTPLCTRLRIAEERCRLQLSSRDVLEQHPNAFLDFEMQGFFIRS